MWNDSRTAHHVRAAFISLTGGMLSVLVLNSLIRVISTPAPGPVQETVQKTAQSPDPQTESQVEIDSPPPTSDDTRYAAGDS